MATPFDAKTDTPTTAVDPLDKFTFGDVSADGWETVLARDLLPALEKARRVVAVAAAATATLGASHRVSGAGPFTLTLPVATEGDRVEIRVAPTFTNLLTLSGGSALVGGLASRLMWASETVVLRFDATDGWQRLGGRNVPMYCSLTRNAAFNLPDSAWSVIPVDTTGVDNTGLMADLANHRIRVVRPEIYLASVNLKFGFAASAGNDLAVSLYKNGNQVLSAGAYAAGYCDPAPAASLPLNFAAGDVLQINAYQNSGAAQPLSVPSFPFTLLEQPSW